MDQRMELVDQHVRDLGLNRSLHLFGVAKSSHYARKKRGGLPCRDTEVKQAVLKVIEENPAYGWRRIQAELADRYDLVVNHKRLKRVLRDHELGLKREASKRPSSGPDAVLAPREGQLDLVRGRTFGPLEAFSTDFTELQFGGGKAWLMVLVDLDSKLAAGWSVGWARNTELALRSLAGLVETLERYGVQPSGRIIHHDKDAVYRGWDWLQAVLVDHSFRVSYSENGARHNPWVESLWSRLKHEAESLISEAQTLDDLVAVLDRHFVYYNRRRRHSTLGNLPPVGYLQSRGFRALSGR